MQIKNVASQVRHNLGNIIRKKRVESAILQKDLSQKVGISTTYLSLLENGKRFPSYETLEKIANSISTKPSELILEASLPKYDEDFKLVCLLSQIIESADKEKIKRLLDLAKSQTN